MWGTLGYATNHIVYSRLKAACLGGQVAAMAIHLLIPSVKDPGPQLRTAMTKRILTLLIFGALLIAPAAQADVIAAGATWQNATYGGMYINNTQAFAQGFTLYNPTMVDSIEVWLYGTQGFNMWLTNQLGTGTTAANVVSNTSGSNVGWQSNTMIVGQVLAPGTYYIAISTSDSSNLVWWFGAPMTGTPGSVAGSSDLVASGAGYNSSFLPASNFGGYSLPLNFLVHDSPSLPVPAPEPTSAFLLASGLAAFVARRRR